MAVQYLINWSKTETVKRIVMAISEHKHKPSKQLDHDVKRMDPTVKHMPPTVKRPDPSVKQLDPKVKWQDLAVKQLDPVLKMNGSMETVLDCVIPYIHDRDDLNSISLLSRKFYELDSLTRKHLTVHAHYAPNPSRVTHRFPFIESLTLKGLPPDWEFPQTSDIDITQWIEEISVKFECLKALHIRGMVVCDSDLKLLAKTRGKDLRSLKIYKCQGFSTDGLMHISKYCNDLRTLCLENNTVVGKENGEWLRELALRNMVIEAFHFGYRFDTYDSKDVTLLAKNCSNSLVSLKISPKPLNYMGDAFRHAIKLEDFDGAIFYNNGDYSTFKFPSSIRSLGIEDLSVTSFSFLLPYVNQLRELNLTCLRINECCQCFLIERCPNLEVLCTDDVCGDMGLRVIGQICKKLRKLTHYGRVTHMGLIALVLTELKLYVTLAEKLHKLAAQLVADGIGLGPVKITYTSSRAADNFDTPLVRAMVVKGIRVNEEQVVVEGSSDKPVEIVKVQIANVESRFAVAISESGEIKVEGRVKDGVPHLTKVGALDVNVSLEGNIILCRQADQQNIIGRVGSILDEENVNISYMSFVRIAQRKEAVMVIGVDGKPSKKALKKIDEIPAVEEFVFIAL
ncbi:hypothetical protein Tco_0289716 [Tanacetum coccineum]